MQPSSPRLTYMRIFTDLLIKHNNDQMALTKKMLWPALTSSKQQVQKTIRIKDSAPSVSQTPAAVIGNSSSLQQSKKSYTKPRQMSLTKTIANQTPNAFKTLGPGFDVSHTEGRSYNRSVSKDDKSITLTGMPSDYEHIFHAPSQFLDNSVIHNDNEMIKTNTNHNNQPSFSNKTNIKNNSINNKTKKEKNNQKTRKQNKKSK